MKFLPISIPAAFFIGSIIIVNSASAFHIIHYSNPKPITQLHSHLNEDSTLTNNNTKTSINQSDRRNILKTIPSIFLLSSSLLLPTTTITSLPLKASAFDNKISNQYDDRPKRKGPQPKDLGIQTRKDMIGEEYIGLKPCGAAPNCFCSTDNIQDDPDHNIPSWVYPKDKSLKDAFMMLEQTINKYKPGQGNIDGGGFQIVKSDLDKGYIYVQFESLKNGYIDDVEFAYIQGFINNNNGGVGGEGDDNSSRAIQVRSSSRVGYLDFAVNAKRLNYIAKALRSQGWDAPGVEADTHRDYFIQNSSS